MCSVNGENTFNEEARRESANLLFSDFCNYYRLIALQQWLRNTHTNAYKYQNACICTHYTASRHNNETNNVKKL